MRGFCKDCESYDAEKMSIDDDPNTPGMCRKGCCRWSDPTTVVVRYANETSFVISGWPHTGPDDRCGFFDTGGKE